MKIGTVPCEIVISGKSSLSAAAGVKSNTGGTLSILPSPPGPEAIRMRLLCWASFCLVALCIPLAGCESEVASRDDLGEVIFRVPNVPGADKPYPMPELGAEPEIVRRRLRRHPFSPEASPMNGKLLIGSLLLLVSSLVVLSPAQANGPYYLAYGLGDTGLGYGGWGCGCCYGPNLPSPAPYFAMHPPVYYSYPVATPYGYSPFPNPPGVVMCEGTAADTQIIPDYASLPASHYESLCAPDRRDGSGSTGHSSRAEGRLSGGDCGKIASFSVLAGIIALDTGGKKP